MELCKKKVKNVDLEKDDIKEVGDFWGWKAISVKSRFRILTRIGKRDRENCDEFVRGIKERSDGRGCIFESDGLNEYLGAFEKYYSRERVIVSEYPTEIGELILRRERVWEEGFKYGRVVKEKKDGKVVKVRREVVVGSEEEIRDCILQGSTSKKINTSYIERDNLTSRQMNGKLRRKTIGFAKKKESLNWQTLISDFYYNFVRSHKSLRKEVRDGRKKWLKETPAMVEGLTDHIWTLKEVLSFRVPPKAKKRKKVFPLGIELVNIDLEPIGFREAVGFG